MKPLHLAWITRAFAICLMSGCVTPPTEQPDPLAGLQRPARPAASPFGNITLGLVYSENTKNSIKFLSDQNRKDLVVPIDIERIFGEFARDFQGEFKSVIKVDSVAESKGTVDLVAVLDLYIGWGRWEWSKSKFSAKAVFITPDGKEIARVDGGSTEIEGLNQEVYAAAGIVRRSLRDGWYLSKQMMEFAGWIMVGRSAPKHSQGIDSLKLSSAEVSRSDIDTPSYAAPENPRNFALIVSIEKYSAIPDAQFAERDAVAVRKHLLALGYPERNILYLTGQQASRATLAMNVESWLPRNVKEDSTVFVYYSGHGAPDSKSGEAYLLPWDGNPQSLEFTAYPLKRLYEKLNALKANKIVVALDACFSGAGGRSVLPLGTRPLITKIEPASESVGKLVVFAASGGDEITGTDQGQGHGLFTYHFLKGLSASRGDATIKGLFDYLLPKVQDGARRTNRDQTPQLLPSDLGNRAKLKLK